MTSVEMTSLEVTESPRAVSYLICGLRGGVYAIEALAVREVLPLPAITPTSGTAALVRGVVDVRGTMVPVVDLGAMLGLQAQRLRPQDALIVLQQGADVVGLVVDALRDVQIIEPLNGAAPTPGTDEGNGCVAGLGRVNGGITQILRLEPLFAAARATTHTNGFTPALRDGEEPTPEESAIFAARAQALSRDATTSRTRDEASDGENELLLAAVALDGEYFGLDLGCVREFSPLRAHVSIPCSPPFIAGLMNLRGETLTLLDIRPSLRMASAGEALPSQVVVIDCDGLRAGVLVDEVLDVWAARAARVLPAPAARDEAHLLRGAVAYRDTMLGLLDLPRLLEEMNAR